MRVAFVIGHTPDSPGACASDYDICEHGYNEAVAQETAGQVEQAEAVVVRRDRPDDYYGLPFKLNDLGVDAAISLHANACETWGVSGSEVLHWHQSESGRDLADYLLAGIESALELPNRGLKGRQVGDRGGHLLSVTRMPTAICEPFFIDHQPDLRRAIERQDALASAYADAIDKWVGSRRKAEVVA